MVWEVVVCRGVAGKAVPWSVGCVSVSCAVGVFQGGQLDMEESLSFVESFFGPCLL